MASSLLFDSQYNGLLEIHRCNSFALCLLGSMNFEFMIRSMFLSMKVYLSLLWSLICMIDYSLVFLLWYLGFVWPTWSIYLAMGRGALWWVRSYGAWSQWQKGNRHVCIVATKDKKMGSISNTIDKRILSTSCHRSYCITPFFHELNTLDACWIAVDVWSNSGRCRQELVY